MQAEVVAVGSELLLGQIIDTNSAVIARHLASIGLNLFYKTTVGDNLARVTATLRQALDRSDVVITTGGIGPTADDITREAVAAATGRELMFSEALMRQIEAYFASRGFTLSPSNRRQAYIPDGAIAVENPVGTAPAFIVEHGERTVITLPGVPREMEYLLVNRAVPYLRERYGIKGEIRLRVLKVVGLGESRVGELLSDFMVSTGNPTVGTVAHLGQVDVRIGAKGLDAADAERLIEPCEAEIRARLGDAVFGADDQTLEGEVAKRLRAAGTRLALVEGGTAGVVSERLAGLADLFGGSVVLSDAASAARLGVSVNLTAEAEARARELAAAVARWADVSVGAAVWFEDIRDAVPPITRVAVAAVTPAGTASREYRLGGDRPSMRIRAATLLLDHVRRALAH